MNQLTKRTWIAGVGLLVLFAISGCATVAQGQKAMGIYPTQEVSKNEFHLALNALSKLLFMWPLVTDIIFIAFLFGVIWFLINRSLRPPNLRNLGEEWNGEMRELISVRCDHLHEESQRFRGLIWTLIPLVWGMYYALTVFHVTENPLKESLLSERLFLTGAFCVSLFSTVFYAFFEVRILRGEDFYFRILNRMGLPEILNWPHTRGRGSRLVFAVTVFLLVIWVPFIVIVHPHGHIVGILINLSQKIMNFRAT